MAKAFIIITSCVLGCAFIMFFFRNGSTHWDKINTNVSHELLKVKETAAIAAVDDVVPAPAAAPSPPGSDLGLNSSRNHILLLHRKKRYLLFPEGSSFQLVFDLIIPIIDYTNFAILGITCAVAWELPSKPPSEILDNLRTRLNDGTLGTVRRNDTIQRPESQQPQKKQYQQEQQQMPQHHQQSTAMNNGDYIRTAANWQSMHAQPSSTSTYAANVHRYSYYTNVQNGGGDTSVYANSPNGQLLGRRPTNWHARPSMAKWRQWADTSPPAVPAAPTASSGDWSDNWWQRNKARVQQNWRQKQQQWNFYDQTTQRSYSYTQRPRRLLQEPPKHRIYPVFGKRRRRRRHDVLQTLDNDIIERLHLRQHFSSRGLLFGKIERLYKSRQLNGTACIQRALCESAQRHKHVDRPQSFIMELLSAIFQLPSGYDAIEASEHIPTYYLEANRERGNCRQLFADCRHTFWLK